MQDLNDKIAGGQLTAIEWNEVPSELQNVIEALGITLSSGDLDQLGKAIAGYTANGTFYTDSGVADAYVLSVIGSKQAPTEYTDGFEAEFVVDNTNSGASTVNVAGLGVVDIAGTGSQGTLITGKLARIRFNAGTGDFDMASVFRSSFKSGDLTITSSGTLTVAHGLGAFPGVIMAFLENQVGEGNWLTGDQVVVSGPYVGRDSLTRMFSIGIDATNLFVRYSDATRCFTLPNKNTGIEFDITNSSWKLILRAYI